jgi:hypothetical protein
MSRVTHTTEVSLGAATLGPWRSAAAVGGIGGGVSALLALLGGHASLGVLARALSVALMLFFAVWGAGAVAGGEGRGGAERRLRRWARLHPWRVALVPTALLLVSDLVERLALGDSAAGAVWDAVWRSAVVALVVGGVGVLARRRAGRG